MKVDIEALRQVAKSATRGPWHWTSDGSLMGRSSYDPEQKTDIFDSADAPAGFDAADAAHIVANSPDVTLALIARIRELENAFEASLDEWNRRDELDVSAGHRNLMRALVAKGTTR